MKLTKSYAITSTHELLIMSPQVWAGMKHERMLSGASVTPLWRVTDRTRPTSLFG